MALVKFSSNVPAAKDLPAGSMILSLSGTDREELRSGAYIYAGLIFAAGVTAGYWWRGHSSSKKRSK